MSVINKMLRDLDHRQATSPASATLASLQRPSGVAAATPAPVPTQGRWRAGALAVLVAVLLAAGWWWQGRQTLPPALTPVTVPAPAVVPAPQAVTPQVSPIPMPAASAPAGDLPAPVAEIPTVPVAPPTGPLPMSLRLDKSLRSHPLRGEDAKALGSEPRAVPAAVPQASEGALLAQRQLQASKDAIVHAQGLWSAGSRDAAMELLQDIVAAAERAAVPAATPASHQLLLAPVRELTRMQLAQAQPQAAWDLLTRLEPLLGNQPDLWAVRANAAQRLGRHQDSVHAYMAALQSRPNEQRWLLGAAVSLAALGQTKSAADMADKARAVGVVGKEVLLYLRQMGVPVKD